MLANGTHALGPVMGPIFFTICLAMWVVVCLPCTMVELIPGYLFGMRTGWVVSMAGKSLGSLISMYLGRHVFKESTEKYIFAKYPIVKKLGVTAEREGFPFLLFIRGMWLPIALKNYGLAVIDVKISDTLLAGFITSIPHSLLWAYLGSKVSNLADALNGTGKKLSVTDVVPGRELVLFGAPVMVAALYVMRNFYLRFKHVLKEDD